MPRRRRHRANGHPANHAGHVPADSAPHTKLMMLTTGQCADWMGVETDYIVAEICEGFLIANNVGKMGHRHDYRIYFPNFVAYLRARRWSRIPIDPKVLS